MSNGHNSPPFPSPGASERRRASVTGQTFQDLFGSRSGSYVGQPAAAQSYAGPITTAAANAQRRRLSLTTLGLGISPGQTSPFPMPRTRTESISSANSGSVDESPFEEDYAASASAPGSSPVTPFARRLSFGARALRDVRQSNGSVGNPNGRPSIHKASSPPTGRGRGEGYNFAENLRSRAERGSVSGPRPILIPNGHTHQRAKSVAIMEPPVREMPKQTKVPDAMQERILKGDFYMD
ncbi:hypothetical protein P153DRAFT_102429 [Dothidotthia symphoricarpi CBS 119687]|uniref:Uncharacterized protein n=1 Tax=Dothidotthia symphoricarpi CBS 119687 TaxID=1392245 RepID=A0A6A6AQA4_9PLEO|nr:uncharacterized protein P153DRAFT_102429 [Dothidotthia symphoricarpi CBS 119687]KAF2133980.1 hypothetical protein P153DRAFT_102429 [Dothidotthia symphoricarpi CBS 119687]